MNTLILRSLPYLVAVLVVGLAVVGIYRFGASVNDTEWQLVQADQKLLNAKGLAAAQQSARAQEQILQTKVNEVGNEAREQGRAVDVDVANASAAGKRLHGAADRLAASAGAASCDTGAAERGKAATRAAMVLSDLLKRADQRAGELAEAYDRARIAGLNCAVTYDEVRARINSAP